MDVEGAVRGGGGGRISTGGGVSVRGFAEVEAVLRTGELWATVPVDLEQRVMAEVGGLELRPELAVVGSAPVVGSVWGIGSRRAHTNARGRGRSSFGGRLGLVAAVGLVVAGAIGVGAVVASGPEGGSVALSGTVLAEDARAVVEVRDSAGGVEIVVKPSGLAPAPVGSFYQGWVKGDRGMVAIGTFHLRDGAEEIALWSGVDLADYPAIAVTLQSEGAGTDSSGRVVLSGQVPPQLR
ncbi:anti-sigma factor domain-containing protein [Kribbella sp. CA-253562]|uniref:anti-sigma factor domain-containing protein n=1 Tax=Kribbella sp. CA-253562 TaxID=3239942 RepID=UPI003D8D8F44